MTCFYFLKINAFLKKKGNYILKCKALKFMQFMHYYKYYCGVALLAGLSEHAVSS